MTTQALDKQLTRLWSYIGRRRKLQLGLLLILMLVASLAEIVSIGAVLPFLSILTGAAGSEKINYVLSLLGKSNTLSDHHYFFFISALFGLTALIAGAIRLILVWSTTRLSFAMGADISIEIYRRTLYQPYLVHCSRNSSEVLSGISTKSNSVIYNVILPILTLISCAFLLVGIVLIMISISPLMTITSFGGFGLIYLLIIALTKKKIAKDSECIARESVEVIKAIQEGLGGIREVLLDGTQEVYCNIYKKSDLVLRKAQGSSVFIASSPRYVMEALGMVLIAFVAYIYVSQSTGIADAIPKLGALALGAQRFLPLLQQAYSAWVNIKTNQASLEDTLELLDQPLPEYTNKTSSQLLNFKKSINIKNISFAYPTSKNNVLENINFLIPKGARIGFIGTTGSGKSTLLDIIMGLLKPSSGSIEVDNVELIQDKIPLWQRHIAHVPQFIFLSDATIEENIALGIPKEKINHERVATAAYYAQLADNIERMPDKYQTKIGEKGVFLSGGQRQRIGIARALYKEANIIVLDEATSALDNKTEEGVMNAISNLSSEITILIIAHRLTTLKNCTQIVELENGEVKKIGSYNEIIH